MTTADLTAEREHILDTAQRTYPYWDTWRGVAGLLYASRRRRSPPAVLYDTTVDGLRRQVDGWEAGHAAPVILG